MDRGQKLNHQSKTKSSMINPEHTTRTQSQTEYTTVLQVLVLVTSV